MSHTRTVSLHMPAHPNQSARVLNVGLCVAVLALLLYYVTQVNALASATWQMRAFNERLSVLRDERNTIVAQESALDDRQMLQSLVQTQGLVPATGVVYLVQDHSVAAR